MSTKIDGKQIAAEIKTNLAERVNKLKAQGIQPGLGTLLVGAAVAAAARVAARPESQGKTLAVILPDGGERYLSTALFPD